MEGEKIETVVLSVDLARRLLKLSLRFPESDPCKKYTIGSRIQATVVTTRDFGALIEIECGVRGLLHKSEMSWKFVTNPKKFAAVGQQLSLRVLRVEVTDPRRISFSLKRSHEARMPFQAELAGKLIGKGGATRRAIEDQCDTDVQIDGQNGIAIITGSEQGVGKATREIEKLIGK